MCGNRLERLKQRLKEPEYIEKAIRGIVEGLEAGTIAFQVKPIKGNRRASEWNTRKNRDSLAGRSQLSGGCSASESGSSRKCPDSGRTAKTSTGRSSQTSSTGGSGSQAKTATGDS